MTLATVLGFFAWIYVVLFIDPFTSGWIGPVSFYISFSMVCLGGYFLLGALFHRIFGKEESTILPRHVRGWFRRSILLTLGTIIPLLLASVDHFSFWTFFACLVVLLGVEAVFLFVNQGRRV